MMPLTSVELQTGEDAEDARRFLIGVACVDGCLADELGQCRGVMLGDIKDEVKWRTTAVAVGVVKVAALEGDGAKESVEVNRTVFFGRFRQEAERCRRG